MNTRMITLCAALFVPMPAAAQDLSIPDDKVLVLGCLEQMEVTTTWTQCLELMFQPCVSETPGSQGHAACLQTLQKDWSGTVKALEGTVTEAVTAEGRIQLLDLMATWNSYVVQKCEGVSRAKPDFAESARLGCEITELVGLADEFAACLEGRSTAEYCEIEG